MGFSDAKLLLVVRGPMKIVAGTSALCLLNLPYWLRQLLDTLISPNRPIMPSLLQPSLLLLGCPGVVNTTCLELCLNLVDYFFRSPSPERREQGYGTPSVLLLR